jgi:hypothetical protein
MHETSIALKKAGIIVMINRTLDPWYNTTALEGGGMRSSNVIGELLTIYFEAPRRLARAKRTRDSLEKRIAYLRTEIGDSAKFNPDEDTLPGLIASYQSTGSMTGDISNPVLATIIRMDVIQPKVVLELQQREAELFDVGQEIDDLNRLCELVDDVLSNFAEDDREMLTLRYRDRLTFLQIAIRVYGEDEITPDESIPRKRLRLVEADLARALRPQSLGDLRRRCAESTPIARRKLAVSTQTGELPLVRSSFAN